MDCKFLLVLLCVCPLVVCEKNYFTAAVFEHKPRGTDIDDPKEKIAYNLQYYEKAVKIAADNGADIVVFNEYGLFPYIKDRNIRKKYVEEIPDPEKVKVNPCIEGSKQQLILTSLSCMAMNNNIYVVANMGDTHSCDGTCDANGIESCNQKCPEDGVLLYNTDVVFDRDGNLIARYHKMHPYFEDVNIPEEPEYITFKTNFGTFGLIVCFDSVFQNSMILARDYEIDTLLFPTFWFDDILPLNAIEWQASWAIANNVNFLAANTQTAGNGSIGSGIFSREYGALVYTYEPDAESKLLLANIPFGKYNGISEVNSSITVIKEDNIYPKVETGDSFPVQSYIEAAGPIKDHYLDYRVYKYQTENYTLIKLENKDGQINDCNNGFCCKLTYSADDLTEDYYFGVFHGLNNVRGYYQWCEETCLLVRCDPFDNKICVMQPSISKTKFSSVKIMADFTSERVYPAVSKSKFRLADKREWKFERKRSTTILEFQPYVSTPLLKAALMGRCYDRDPPYEPFFKY